jgi:hypothetical protein
LNLDRLILGANPLCGVDHFSSDRARERSLQLSRDKILAVVKASFSAGATGFNFSPHPIVYNILKKLREEECSYAFGLYPMFPDTQTYVKTQLTSGTTGMLKQLLGDLGVMGSARALVQGGLSWMTADPLRAMKLYLDMEIDKLLDIAPSNSRLKTVLAHEVLTDLALAFRSDNIIRIYFEHLKDKHRLVPGFVTRNFPRFVDFCVKHDLPLNEMIIMTPFNRLGFQMIPSREACERTLSRMNRKNVIGISVLAGGQLGLDEAFGYLKPLKIGALAVGVSNEAHARESFTKLAKALE